MHPSPGTRLGPYEIVARLGAGGMGELFRARDTRLGRDVAIKMLPAELAHDTTMHLRLEREAKAISQLNHPNICTLYDVGENYLVMELLEGENLAERLSRGPLSMRDVVRYGSEICDALDRAHRAGIVHRDLKPGNVMITPNGAKLLDFGLARQTRRECPSENHDSRTLQKPVTTAGFVVGTPQYMSPEQLQGAAVDHRTDIFALGALLYEMATARPAFDGTSHASVVAAILTTMPETTANETLDHIVRTCLEKNADDRFHSAHDVRIELQWLSETERAGPPKAAKRRGSLIAWAVAAFAVVATIAIALSSREQERPRRPVVSAILPPAGTDFDFGRGGLPELSPDGTHLVFGAESEGTRTLWVRALDENVPRQLAGTEGARFPMWSPDGRHVAFFTNESLKRIPLDGGAALTICPAPPEARGGSWSTSGVIVFSGRLTPIYSVPAGGGTARAITTLDPAAGEASHRWPQFLPGSERFLFLAGPGGGEEAANRICVASIRDGRHKAVFAASSHPEYFGGRIFYTDDGVLMSRRFDLARLTVSEPVTLPYQEIAGDRIHSRSVLTISGTGTLVYAAGKFRREAELVWHDRSGKILGKLAHEQFGPIELSPDERTLLAGIRAETQANLWRFDLERNARTRVTFEKALDTFAVWSPDATRIAYTSNRGRRNQIMLMDVNQGSERVLVARRERTAPWSWSADGKTIFYSAFRDNASRFEDLYYYSFVDSKSHPYLITPFGETAARISPDGRWVAYHSDESGNPEVYIAPFPHDGTKWQVSTAGGTFPRWSANGAEIIYVTPTVPTTLTAAPVSFEPRPRIGKPKPLFEVRLAGSTTAPWDLTADGRVIAATRTGPEHARPLTLVVGGL